MARFSYEYPDLGGGINQGSPPAAIDSREMSALKNFYPYSTRLRRRGGVRRLTDSAWDENITGMFPLKLNDGTWVLIVGGLTKFGKLDGSTITDLPFGSGVAAPGSSALPWVFFQYKDYAYAMKKDLGTIYRINGTSVLNAGIARPSSALTIAEGAAGALSAGDYRTVHTYYNRETANESNPSEVSNTLGLGASKKINYSGISLSSNPFVNARRIYRTLPDQVGTYFFVFQISDNATTTFSGEEVAVADLGRTVSFDNGEPPSGLDTGTIWNERLFVSDGTDLMFSEYLLAEAFSTDVIPVFPDDGHVIRGLLGFGDRLIIGKTNKVHYLVGTDRSSFAIFTLSDTHGVMSQHSLKTAEGLIFWYGSGKKVFRSDGTVAKDISTPYVEDVLNAIPDEDEERVVGAVFPALSWYVLSVPQSSGDNNSKVLIYNYKYNTWTIFEHPSDAPQFIGDFFNTNYGHVLYSTFYDGHLSHYNDEDYETDWGTAIDASFTTKKDDFGFPGVRKFFKEVWMLAPKTAGASTLQLEVLRDELSTAVVDRTVDLDIEGSEWKSYKISSSRNPGTTNQLRVTYSGGPQIEIDQLHFELGLLARRPGRAQ